MIELKYPEKIHSEEYDINIRPYLKIAEIKAIAEGMLEIEDLAARLVYRDSCLLQYTTDIEGLEDMDYDLLQINGVIDYVSNCVRNADAIDAYVMQMEDISHSIKVFTSELLKMADKFTKKLPKGKELEKILAEAKDVVIKNGESSK